MPGLLTEEGRKNRIIRHWASWKSESAKSPPVCVVGVGEGVGLDPYLSMAYPSGFHQGFCFI